MSVRRWRAIALAGPGCALSAGLVAALVGALIGRNPIWPDGTLTLSEAVVTRADADVVRLIGSGRDPNAPYDVRAGLLTDQAVRVTPLEAAVLAHDAYMLTRLLREGALLEPAAWNRLRCLAGSEGEVAAVLDRQRPAGAMPRCEDVRAP